MPFNPPPYSHLCRYGSANPGFAHTFQLINVPDFMGRGESTPSAHFYQNLGEAEYVFDVLHVFAFTFACSRTHK